MPDINDLRLTSDGNVLVDSKETAQSSLMVLKWSVKLTVRPSDFTSSVTGVFNGNIIGNPHDDVIMSQVGSVYSRW